MRTDRTAEISLSLSMADSTSSPSPSHHANGVVQSSCFQRTVSLFDWWLVKAENDFQGKRLAVGGISSRNDEAMRVFVSAPIVKRFDVFSLETADGIYITIKGFINEKRTIQNGFPSENPLLLFNNRRGFRSNFDTYSFNIHEWESYAVNFFKEESTSGIDLGNTIPANVSEIGTEILSDGVEKSSPTSLVSQEKKASGNHEKPFPEDECNASKEMHEVNAAFGNDCNRRNARLHNIKVCQKKNKPECPPKHPDKEQSSTPVALENPDGQELKSPVTPVQPQPWEQVNMSSEQLVRKSASRISRTLSANTEGCYKEKRVTVKTKMISTERKMTRSASAMKYTQERDVSPMIKEGREKSASGQFECPLNHPDKEQSFALGSLENPDGQELKSPVTPVQPQSRKQVNKSSKQFVRKSASRISQTLSANTDGCCKKKRVTVNTRAISTERKMTRSAPAVKYTRERDVSPTIKEGKEKISLMSSESSGFRKSRSGRLLLPPLEFWRNQIPVYNADHEITEIQGGASLVSPCKDPSPSLGRKGSQSRKRQRR